MPTTAHREATTTPVAEMTAELQELLGQRVVAYATGVRSVKAVSAWVNGSDPHRDTERKLRALYRIVLILKDEFGPGTVRAWLSGANPDLAERVPLDVLREGGDVEVITAAQDFAEE